MIAALVLATALSGNAAAQADFNHGLFLYYAYNGEDAMRYFRRALAEDPHFAMAAWGAALAAGPDLNTDLTEQRFADGARAISNAAAIRSYASPTEQAYIDAMALRYHGSWSGHESDATAYRKAMIALATANPSDLDAQDLTAEALLEHGDVEAAKKFVKRALADDPTNIMANHLCIHVYDDAVDRTPAISCAKRLDALRFEPAAEHLAHMPAHVWIETGDYNRAVATSLHALALFDRLLSDGNDHSDHRHYLKHDTYIGYSAAMMGGNYATAAALARRAERAYGKPYFALTALRFGRIDGVAAYTQILTTLSGDAAKGSIFQLIEARIAEAKGNDAEASRRYERAQTLQHQNFSAEEIPLFPAETEHGAFLLRQGEHVRAEAAFRAALARYPNDPRAIFGLAQTLTAQNKIAEAAIMTRHFNDVWAGADTKLDLKTL